MKKWFLLACLAIALSIFQTSKARNTPTLLTPVSNSNAVQGTIGKWEFTTKTDPLTDVKKSYLVLRTSERDALVTARCTSDVLNIYLVTNEFLNSKDLVPVLYRFDKDPVVQAGKWDVSTNGTAVFVPDSMLVSFFKQALPAQSFVIRVTKYTGVELTYQFDWTGFDVASKQLPCIDAWLLAQKQKEERELAAKRQKEEKELALFNQIEMILFTCEPLKFGYAHASAKFKNTGDTALKNLTYTIEFFEGEEKVAENTSYIEAQVLLPGKESTFNYLRIQYKTYSRCELHFSNSARKFSVEAR